MTLCALFHSASPARCHEFNLVLQAVGVPGQVVEHEQRHYLLVEEAVAHNAYQQLALYIEENAAPEILSKPLLPMSSGYVGAYIYTLVLLIVGMLKNTAALGVDWRGLGLAHSEKILSGQWWRSITALTLHADIAHLAGNIGFGALFGVLVSRYIGAGAAWLMILVSGAMGNVLNALLYQQLHLSLGASTMVFAALGMLGVFALKGHDHLRQRGIRRWLPFIATLALLAFTGTAGERTDVFAHLSGYFCGCLSALLWLVIKPLKRIDGRSQTSQIGFAMASLALIIIAWVLALS